MAPPPLPPLATAGALLLLTATVRAAPPADFRVKGLVAPTFTPMAANGTLDLAKIPSMAASLNASGVHWVFSAGSTGESVDLTVAEREAMAEAWVSEVGRRTIVHVGADSVSDAAAMAAHAQRTGAGAIAAMAPTYIKPKTVDALVRTLAVVAAAAPDLPFYYYHIPSMTGAEFNMIDFVAAADGEIPTLRGIKFTDYHLDDFQECLEYTLASPTAAYKGSKLNMLFGRDQYFLSAVALGCDAAVGTTYNWNGELQNRILAAAADGDWATARAAQLAASRFIAMGHEYGSTGVYAWKEVMAVIPGMPSVGPARLPYLPGTAEGRERLAASIRAWCAATPAGVRPQWCATM